MSSCATAARAIITAVGFWICISRRRTLPSLVSLMSVARCRVSGVGFCVSGGGFCFRASCVQSMRNGERREERKESAALAFRSVPRPADASSPPEPPTSILIVPLGPKLVFMTSSRPFAALMFMKRAAVCPMVSARGLSVLTDMVGGVWALGECSRGERGRQVFCVLRARAVRLEGGREGDRRSDRADRYDAQVVRCCRLGAAWAHAAHNKARGGRRRSLVCLSLEGGGGGGGGAVERRLVGRRGSSGRGVEGGKYVESAMRFWERRGGGEMRREAGVSVFSRCRKAESTHLQQRHTHTHASTHTHATTDRPTHNAARLVDQPDRRVQNKQHPPKTEG